MLLPKIESSTLVGGRWGQLCFGILCMVCIANLQYGWTLFVAPMQEAHGWTKAAIQTAFTVFIVFETWLVPFDGYLIDRLGPKRMVLAGGAMIGLSWMLNAGADTLAMLYFNQAVGGLGAGIIYGAMVGNAVKWFPDRRGLAAGLTAAGFGAGTAVSIFPISLLIKAEGYESAFFWFGLAQAILVIVAALMLVPPPVTVPRGLSTQKSRDLEPQQVLRHPIFWLLYLMFVLVATGGLVVTAQLAVMAKDFNVADVPVSLAGLTMPALVFALSIDRVLNGVTRPFFGWVSDHIGRENTMFGAFFLEGLGIIALLHYAYDPVLFVILSGLVFFAWGEIYSLFPALCTDIFGSRFATTNYGMLYTAKGVAAILVPFSSVLSEAGNWSSVLYLASGFNIMAALLALFVLKPYDRSMVRDVEQGGRKLTV